MRKAAIILAAGKGTRLKSRVPKALQTICGRPMVGYLVERAELAGCEKIVVVAGHGIAEVRAYLSTLGKKVVCVEQKEQLGSGHAVLQAQGALKGFSGAVYVFYCDTPLIRHETVKELYESFIAEKADCTLLSVEFDRPKGYGRILRGPGAEVTGIVEENDATDEQRAIKEINVGCYVFGAAKLFESLKKVGRSAVKKEYYLTDVVGILAGEGRVGAVMAGCRKEVLGVNTQEELAEAEEIAQKRIIRRHMEAGVRVRRPHTVTIDADVTIGQDTTVMPGTVLEEGTAVGQGCTLGPHARIRGKSVIGSHSVIGNFVEVVRSQVGERTQVKHLSYLGDAVVGSRVNIGCGTITANYDGKNKHRTVIKDGAHIGSGTVLVAPVTVGKQAVTGAGAVVTKNKNVPDRGVVAGVPARILARKGKK